jgi:FkbM family methyltransferase
MDFISYSQYGEDCILWHFFNKKPQGFFIDVGAFDGIFLSNSYGLERMGWRGICVEPGPRYFGICKANRPDCICVNASCVGNEEVREVLFYQEPLGLFSGIEADIKKVKDAYKVRNIPFAGLQEVRVPAITLNAILEKNLPEGVTIDVLSIDVEGSELDVLHGIDFIRFSPRVVVLEANTTIALNQIAGYMSDFGYHMARQCGVNYLFVKTDTDIKHLSSIDVECSVAEIEHPLEDLLQKDSEKKKKNVPIQKRLKQAISVLLGRDRL